MSGTCGDRAMPKALSPPASQKAPNQSSPPPLGVEIGRAPQAPQTSLLRRTPHPVIVI